MKLIDKAAVVAEINKRIMDAPIDCYGHQRVWAYNDVKNILDTLEVKEVDFEKIWKECFKFSGDVAAVSVKPIAKYFFELGMAVSNKAQEGE